MQRDITSIRNTIEPIARAHGVSRVFAFGSYAKQTATERSDLDLRIDEGAIGSLFALSRFRLAVEDALLLPVDIVTSGHMDTQFLSDIKLDEVLIYDEQRLPNTQENY